MKNMMNRHFWTGQNSKLLLFALAPIPIIAGGVIFLMDRIDARESHSDEHVAVAEATIVKPEIAAVEVAAVEKADETSEAEVEKDSEETSSPEADETMLNRFVERLDQVAESSNLHDARQQLKSGLANAETVELISTTVFESGHRAMSKQQLADLETSLEESSAIEKYLSNPDATLVVLGYADQVGDESANNLVALYRAENVREALKDSSQIDGAKLEIKSWFVGETDILSEEQGVAEKESNRAAEIWLIVHDGDLFDEIGSDIKSPAAKCNLYTSDNASHRKQISSNGRSRVSSRHLPTRNNGHAPKSSRCEKN